MNDRADMVEIMVDGARLLLCKCAINNAASDMDTGNAFLVGK